MDFIADFGEIEPRKETKQEIQWSIDWDWYDQIVAESEKERQDWEESERKRKENLLIDFDELVIEDIKLKDETHEPLKPTLEKDLMEIFKSDKEFVPFDKDLTPELIEETEWDFGEWTSAQNEEDLDDCSSVDWGDFQS